MKPKRKNKISWIVTNHEGWWWVPKIRSWERIDDLAARGFSFSNMAKPKNKKMALLIARKCPADQVIIVMRCGRRTRKYPRGWEREYVL